MCESLPIGNVSSIPPGYLPAGNNAQNGGMDEHKVREKHVGELIRERFDGKKSAFAKAVDVDPSIVSRWLTRKNHKNIGEQLARQIEDKLGLEPNSLDRDAELAVGESKSASGHGWPFSPALRTKYKLLTDIQKLQLEARVEEIIWGFAKSNALDAAQHKSKPRRVG